MFGAKLNENPCKDSLPPNEFAEIGVLEPIGRFSRVIPIWIRTPDINSLKAC